VRRVADARRIRSFLSSLGREALTPVRAYLAGGATAVLLGWRDSTIDVDLKLEGEGSDELLRAIPRLKEDLQINVELATPDEFIPVPEGWQDRSRFESQIGQLMVFHFELVWQAIAKIHRGHRQDLEDARSMLRAGLVDEAQLREAFDRIGPQLYRFPNIDPPAFRRAVEAFLSSD